MRPAPTPTWPADIGAPAKIGLAGEYLGLVAPQTEADPNALLLQFLTLFGNCVGRGVALGVGRRRPLPLNLYTVIVGPTSRGRKGTAWHEALRPFEVADPRWVSTCLSTGLSTGEGLIKMLYNREMLAAMRQSERPPEPDSSVPTCLRDLQLAEPAGRSVSAFALPMEDGDEAGVRFMIFAPEFGRVLRQNLRGGNTLSDILRELFDDGRAEVLTRKEPLRVTNAHVSLVGHCTPADLQALLTRKDVANGYANRVLWCLSEMRQSLPLGAEPGPDEDRLYAAVRRCLTWGQGLGEPLQLSPRAKEVWTALYRAEDDAGRSEIVARGQMLMLRLASIYAALDRVPQATPEHLRAAEEVWCYCRESALALGSSGEAGPAPLSRREERIVQEIRAVPEGLTRPQLVKATSGNYRIFELQEILDRLTDRGRLLPYEGEDGLTRWRFVGDS